LPPLLGLDPKWGAAGLTASAGIAGWLEFFLLRRALNLRIGVTGLPVRLLTGLWAAALTGAGAGLGVGAWITLSRPLAQAVLVLTPFGIVYLGLTMTAGLPEAGAVARRLIGRSQPDNR
jgi:putative peptidoglycan lipid II flippase